MIGSIVFVGDRPAWVLRRRQREHGFTELLVRLVLSRELVYLYVGKRRATP